MENIIEFGDNREIMKRWAQQGVKIKTCVTSPPYYGLRDYGTGSWSGGDPTCDHIERHSVHGGERADRDQSSQIFQYKDVCEKCGAVREDKQLGQEPTPEQYIENMVDVFRHVRDILDDDGTLWINIGDSYASQGGKGQERHRDGRDKNTETQSIRRTPGGDVKVKDLIGIPWMLAFALRADGWYLRQDIIWSKPNPMPESVSDRCTKAHEYVFLLSKSERYYFDHIAIKEPVASSTIQRLSQPNLYNQIGSDRVPGKINGNMKAVGDTETRNKRSVWVVNTKPYKGAHFATYPEELIEPCVLAGSKFGDIVFDPFMGSGTTASVAIKHGRKYLGCELNHTYKPLQDQRLKEAHNNKPGVFEGDTNSLFTFD
jgi:DNA modification methylase